MQAGNACKAGTKPERCLVHTFLGCLPHFFRDSNGKGRSLMESGLDVDRAIMQIDDFLGPIQPDAGAAGER